MKLWPNSIYKRIFADAAAGYANPGSLHDEGRQAKEELERARAAVAQSVGAHADEIVFTSGGTEANNLAIFGTLRKLLRGGGDVHAITTAIEHASVLEPLRALVRDGLVLTELGVNSEGLIDIKELREAITDTTTFVSVQIVNSEVGTIQNIREIAKTIRHIRKDCTRGSTSWKPLYFHTDAAQAPLWMDIQVESLGVDMLTLDAQKVLGPKGVGALYIKRGVELEPLIYGGGQEKGLRSGTENAPLASEFAAALAVASEQAQEQAKKVSEVRDFLIAEIKKYIPEAIFNGPSGDTRVANNLSVSIPNLDGQMAVVAMNAEGVAISTRSACSSEDEELSYVLLALGISPEMAKNTIRITLLPDATMGEAEQIAKKLAEVAKRYRS